MEQEIRLLTESYYDLQHLRIETFNRIVAYVKSHERIETQVIDASHHYVETHKKTADNTKKFSTIANQMVNGKIEVPADIGNIVWYHNMLHETEKELAKRLNAWSSKHPIRIRYLSLIRGIGPVFSSALIAWLSPISRFDNISRLWSYSGLAPGQKRVRGQKLGYNPRLKTLMWKIASSFEKQNAKRSVYRKLYDEKKKYLLKRPDLAKAIRKKEKGARLHVRLLAMRFVEKRFLANLWLTWRAMEKLPVTKPYAIDQMEHSGYEEPAVDREQPDE